MTCNCGNLQCYVCGQNIKDYRHFEQVRADGTKCPLHENNESRLEAKILSAREDAVKKVLEEEEGLKEEDVKVDAPVPSTGAGVVLPPMGPGMVQLQMMNQGRAAYHQINRGPVIMLPQMPVRTSKISLTVGTSHSSSNCASR